MRGGPVTLKIGDPIPTAGMKLPDRAHLTETLSRQVAELAGEAPDPVETPRHA